MLVFLLSYLGFVRARPCENFSKKNKNIKKTIQVLSGTISGLDFFAKIEGKTTPAVDKSCWQTGP